MVEINQQINKITGRGHCEEHDACMNLTGIVNAFRAISEMYEQPDAIKADIGFFEIDINNAPGMWRIFIAFKDALEQFNQAYPGNIIFSHN